MSYISIYHTVQVYISDCIGVQWIGLFVITFGTCSGLSALIAGRLAKYIPQFVFYYLSALILCCVLLFLIFWERQPSYVVAFVPPALIGICEGTFNSLPPTLVGILYHDKQEQAYSVLRMGFAVGYLMGFAFSIFLDFGQISWIIIAFILLSTLTYSVVVFVALPRRQLLPCLYIRKSDDDDDKDHTSSNPTTTNDTKFIVDEMELQVKLPQNGTIDS
jgi:MFS family permease